MAMNSRRNPLSALLDYANARGDEASSIGSVMTQLASPILKGQGVQVDDAVQRGPVPQPTLVDVDPATIKDPMFGRMVQQESGGQSGLVSPKGAAGLAQVLPSTAMDPGYGVPTIFDMADAAGVSYPDKSEASAKALLLNNDALNLQMGQAYKDAMSAEFGGDPAKTAAAYNAGPGAVNAYGGVPPYPETQGYVANVVPGYNIGMGSMSAPEAGGGALPQTVEGILSSLYPNAAEDEKAAHRKDIWRGLSQGLSALSQGNQVDLSNIATNADQRRRQNVLDMRERERARAGAALIYSQTGDADMAGAVAGGLMSLDDVFSKRERDRLAEQADAQRLKTEQANKALGGLVLGMTSELGLSDERAAEVATALDNGAEPSSVLTLTMQSKLADEARKKEEAAVTAREKRNAVAEEYAASEDPLLRLTGQLLLSDPNMAVAEGYKLASDRFPVAKDTAPAPTNEMQNADALVASGAINPDTKKPFTPAEATAVLTLPAPAGSEQSNAQNEAQDLFTKGATNPDTGKPFKDYGEALAWRLGSGGSNTNVEVYTGSTGQEVAPALVAAEEKLVAKGQMFARVVNPETGQLDIVLTADGSPKIINIGGGEAETAANADTAAKQADAEKATMRAVRQTLSADTILRYGKDVLDKTAEWEAGVGQGLATMAAGLIPQTVTSEVQNRVSTIKSLTSLDNLTAMRLASPTGGALGSVSDAEGSKLESQFGALDVKGDPAILREDTRAAMNSYLDTVHGTPEKILQLYKDGKISAEDADAFSARYVIRGSGVDPEQERIGTTTNLGLSGVRTTVLGDLTDQDIAPTAIKELGVGFEEIIQDDTFFDEGGAFDTLSPTAQAEVKRLMGVK
jgi:hypothetical protein